MRYVITSEIRTTSSFSSRSSSDLRAPSLVGFSMWLRGIVWEFCGVTGFVIFLWYWERWLYRKSCGYRHDQLSRSCIHTLRVIWCLWTNYKSKPQLVKTMNMLLWCLFGMSQNLYDEKLSSSTSVRASSGRMHVAEQPRLHSQQRLFETDRLDCWETQQGKFSSSSSALQTEESRLKFINYLKKSKSHFSNNCSLEIIKSIRTEHIKYKINYE